MIMFHVHRLCRRCQKSLKHFKCFQNVLLCCRMLKSLIQDVLLNGRWMFIVVLSDPNDSNLDFRSLLKHR